MCLADGCAPIGRRAVLRAALALPVAACAPPAFAAGEDVVQRTMSIERAGAAIDLYVAWREDRREAPIAVVMHGNAGLPEDVRETADWLARFGYVGLAVNPTSREPDPSTIPRAVLAGRGFGDRYIEDSRAGLAQLRRERIGRAAGPIAVVGYCGGGYCGLLWSDTPYRAELGALVGMHVAMHNFNADGSLSTGRPQGMDLYRGMSAPAQFHYGTADTLTPERHMEELRAEAARLGRTLELYGYDGADHGFAMSTQETYRADYSAQIRERTGAFLARCLV